MLPETAAAVGSVLDERLPSGGWWSRLPWLGGGAGLVGLGLASLLAGGDWKRFAFSYLVAYLFVLTTALGALFFVLVQHVCRAGWSVGVRRVAENLTMTLPLLAILFVPIGLCVHDLYHWAHPEAVAGDAILRHKAVYLNPVFFYARAAFYLLAWSSIAWWFHRRSCAQDESGDLRISRQLRSLSAPALIVFALTITLAAFDWVMSLEPHWYSTIYGVYLFSGSVVGGVAAIILLSMALQGAGRLARVVRSEHYHDLGKLLFAFTVFWAYIAFSQFMLIWYANLPEETVWFAERWSGSWRWYSIALAVGHFGIPFFGLLGRDVKRFRGKLAIGACWMLLMHLADLYWLVMPTFASSGVPAGPIDLASVVGVGGLALGWFSWVSGQQRLVPVRDPRLAESLVFENL